MATIVETIEQDGEIINVYETGARYNVTRGHLVAPATANLITAENSIALNRRRQELARAELVAGANEAVAHLKPDMMPTSGDLAYVRAIGYATAQKAMTPKDPKQTDAARLLLNVGERLGEERNAPATTNTVNIINMPEPVARALVDLRRLLSGTIPALLHDTDAGVIDAD